MIRGPVLPLQRDGLWRLMRQRSSLFERGFRVIAEQLELGTAGLPPVDGLLRDAGGSPVLVFVTDDRDTSLIARVLAAHAFWLRNAEGMAQKYRAAAKPRFLQMNRTAFKPGKAGHRCGGQQLYSGLPIPTWGCAAILLLGLSAGLQGRCRVGSLHG